MSNRFCSNGSTFYSVQKGTDGGVLSLTAIENVLFVAGSFASVDNNTVTANNIAQFNGMRLFYFLIYHCDFLLRVNRDSGQEHNGCHWVKDWFLLLHRSNLRFVNSACIDTGFLRLELA